MASKVCPSGLDTRIFLKKISRCGPPDKKEKASNCLVPKGKRSENQDLGPYFYF